MDRGGDASSAPSSEVTFEWGQQAGLFWYVDDNNYLKLVLEGMKDGGCAVVLAGEKNAVPAVIAKVPVAAKDILRPGGGCGCDPLVLCCLVYSCLVLSCLILSYLVLSSLVLSCLVFSCLVMSCLQRAKPHFVLLYFTLHAFVNK